MISALFRTAFFFVSIYFINCQLSLAQVCRLPVHFNGKHMFIKLGVGKSDSLSFPFDSGATGTLIDSLTAKNAGVSSRSTGNVEAVGDGGAQQYTVVSNEQLNLWSDIAIDNVDLVLMNLSRLRKELKINFDGIVGYDILKKYVTKIDFDRSELSLYKGIGEIDTNGYTAIPFLFSKGKKIPRFPITIATMNDEHFTGLVMFDTGAANTLFISAPFKNFHGLTAKMGKIVKIKGSGLNNTTSDEKALVKSLNFSGFDFGKMIVGLAVSDPAEKRDGYLGLLGMGIIKRFNVILDYSQKKIYLKPNDKYNQPFDTVLN